VVHKEEKKDRKRSLERGNKGGELGKRSSKGQLPRAAGPRRIKKEGVGGQKNPTDKTP